MYFVYYNRIFFVAQGSLFGITLQYMEAVSLYSSMFIFNVQFHPERVVWVLTRSGITDLRDQ